jgi:hypothetical protein
MRLTFASKDHHFKQCGYSEFCLWPIALVGPGRACRLCPGTSDVNLLCYGQRVVDLNPKGADCALDLRMAEE